MTPPAKTKRAVFSIHERNGKTYWTRIGAATENRDGSLTLKLDALPLGGTLHIRTRIGAATENRDGSLTLKLDALPLGSTLHIRDDVRDDVKKENPDG